MLATPQWCEILPLPIQSKIWACLATCFKVQKNDVQSIIKLDQPITQYGRVYGLDGGDHMTGYHFVKETDDGTFIGAGTVAANFGIYLCNN